VKSPIDLPYNRPMFRDGPSINFAKPLPLFPLPGVVLPFGWFWPWGGREVWPYVSNIADLWLIIGMMILIITSRGGVAKTASNIAGGPQGSA
jgi:hypothetical protein